jgi:hypothetical protein
MPADAPGGGTVFYVDLPSVDRRAHCQAEVTAKANPAPLAPGDEIDPPEARRRAAGGVSRAPAAFKTG